MTLDLVVVQEIEYPKFMSFELLDKWADGIPIFSKRDAEHPEWKPTPVFPLDLSSEGAGRVYIKNEADRSSNPTGTIKDRAAWELTTLFRDYARAISLRKKAGLQKESIDSLEIPRFSVITAGNVGKALSEVFKKYQLPPIKIIVDFSISSQRLEALKKLYADIYMVDLSRKKLSPQEIKKLTNNGNGLDITSVKSIEPNAIFYDWHVHESFNENPDEIYVPYGSGRVFENYLTWQYRTSRSANERDIDPRLRTSIEKVIGISILGAEPERADSAADKLTKRYNFDIFDDEDISALSNLRFTGKSTGVYRVPESKIRQAYEILSKYCETEPSGSAGLALYLQRFNEGKIDTRDKVLIVNTGKGI